MAVDYSIISQAGKADSSEAILGGIASGISSALKPWIESENIRIKKENAAKPIAKRLVSNSILPEGMDPDALSRTLYESFDARTLNVLLANQFGGNKTLTFSTEPKGIQIGDSDYWVSAPSLTTQRSQTERDRGQWSKFKDAVDKLVEAGKDSSREARLKAVTQVLNERSTNEIEQIRSYAFGSLTWDKMVEKLAIKQGWAMIDPEKRVQISDKGQRKAREIFGDRSREELQRLLFYDINSPLQDRYKLGLIATINNPYGASEALVTSSRKDAEEEQGLIADAIDGVISWFEPEEVTSKEIPTNIQLAINNWSPSLIQEEIENRDATQNEVLQAIAQSIVPKTDPDGDTELRRFVFNMLKAKISMS